MPNMYDHKACRNLIAKIILLAIVELKDKSGVKRQDARLFLMSDYAGKLASYIDIDMEVVRERMKIK
jgi:hypothetical protein